MESSGSRISAIALPTPQPPPPSPSPLNLGLPHEELYITSDTPDANNILFESSGSGCTVNTAGGSTPSAKSVATIQPISLNFSHFAYDESGEKRRCNAGGTLRRRCNHPNSGDSDIEVEVIELPSSPRRNRRKRCSSSPSPPPFVRYVPQQRHRGDPNCGALVPTVHSSSPLAQLSSEYKTTEMLDLTFVIEGSGMRGAREHATNRSGRSGGDNGVNGGGSLRRRWLRFFRSCLQCSDPQPRRSLDNSAQQQTFTQIPLLGTTTIEYCREERCIM